MDEQSVAFESLTTVLTALSENPTSEQLHYQSLALSEKAGLSSDELEGARDTLTLLFPTTDGTRDLLPNCNNLTCLPPSCVAPSTRYQIQQARVRRLGC